MDALLLLSHQSSCSLKILNAESYCLLPALQQSFNSSFGLIHVNSDNCVNAVIPLWSCLFLFIIFYIFFRTFFQLVTSSAYFMLCQPFWYQNIQLLQEIYVMTFLVPISYAFQDISLFVNIFSHTGNEWWWFKSPTSASFMLFQPFCYQYVQLIVEIYAIIFFSQFHCDFFQSFHSLKINGNLFRLELFLTTLCYFSHSGTVITLQHSHLNLFRNAAFLVRLLFGYYYYFYYYNYYYYFFTWLNPPWPAALQCVSYTVTECYRCFCFVTSDQCSVGM